MFSSGQSRHLQDFLWGKEAPPTPGAKLVVDKTTKLHLTVAPVLAPLDLAVRAARMPLWTDRPVQHLFRGILLLFNQRLKEAAPTKDRREKAGMAADVIHLEESLGRLAGVPIGVLRAGLPELGLVLPPMVK